LPKVSVCIDVYNYADFLPEAIESVLRQTLVDCEILIVDDNSTDGSLEIARAYAARDSRIAVHHNATNLGMVRNRNACLAAARGQYVKFVHADDFLFSPHALARLAEALDANPAIVLAASRLQFVDRGSRPQDGERSLSSSHVSAGASVILRSLLEQKNLIGPPSAVMFRRSAARRGFDEDYFHAADWEMWCHLLEQGCFSYVDEPLIAYRWHPRQQTEQDRKTLSQFDDHRRLLDRYLPRPYVRFHPWAKRFLRHEVERQALRRCRRMGFLAEARAALSTYGWLRYGLEEARFSVWRRRQQPLRHWKTAYLPPARGSRHVARPAGINVSGFVKGEYGIGEASRAFTVAIRDAGIPCSVLNIRAKDHRNEDQRVSGLSDENPYAINLMTFSFDYARRYFLDRGPQFFEGRRNAAVWFWELEAFPARFHANFDYYDEIWTPSAFSQRAFTSVSPIPVHHVPYPLGLPSPTRPDRARFSLPDDAFVFLFTFDFWSEVERKNPIGLLHAFRRAFAPGESTVLVLKSINAAAHAGERSRLARAAEGLNVTFVDEHLTHTELLALHATADCYVSLHRSEGLGLGMAQSMALGKPVIATGYSGNLEYMTRDNSLLVDYELRDIDRPYGPYEPGGRWAEPDLDQAAQHMRWIATHPEEAAAIGERGQRDVRSTLHPARCIAAIRERIAAP
jgi:glycosyltransferase involved in cell wall biosynthesis